jgi:hypothetical protein
MSGNVRSTVKRARVYRHGQARAIPYEGASPVVTTPERKVPRLHKSLPFILEDGWRGDVVDLSAAGMRIRSLAQLEAQSTIEGQLILGDGRSIAVRGIVTWTQAATLPGFDRAEMGLQLVDVSDEYLNAVAELFAQDS